MSEIGLSQFQTVPKSGRLSVPISEIRLHNSYSKSGQPNCPKSEQTNQCYCSAKNPLKNLIINQDNFENSHSSYENNNN